MIPITALMLHRLFGFISHVDNVNCSPRIASKADFSNVSPSLGRKLCFHCLFFFLPPFSHSKCSCGILLDVNCEVFVVKGYRSLS